MTNFSTEWKSSSKPKKQRKYRLNAVLHVKQKFMHSHLSKELRKKYGKRSMGLRKGDRVKILRGQFKKHEGKVERIDMRNTRVFINGAEYSKKDGTTILLGMSPSNIMITELAFEDKSRQKLAERK